MKKLLSLLTLVLLLSGYSLAAPVAYSYQIAKSFSAPGTSNVPPNTGYIAGTGAAFHQLTWNVIGTLSGCSVRVDSSADGITYSVGDVIAAQTCTTNNQVISSSIIPNYIRINVTSLTGAGSLVTILDGYVNNPASGGGSIGVGVQGEPVIYTSSTVAGASNQSIDASAFAGTTITDKIGAANTALGVGGGTIVVPDSISGTTGTTTTLSDNVNLYFSGSGVFTLCTINAGKFSHIWGHVTLRASGTNCHLISQANITVLQVNQQFIVDGGLTFDGNSQVGAIGLYCTLCASAIVKDVTFINFLDSTVSTNVAPVAALVLFGTQFASFHDLKFYGNYVDIKCYGLTGGGCNMNSFDHITSTGFGNSQTPVGAIFYQPVLAAGSGGQVSYGNHFNNSSFLSHTVANVANFGNTAIGSGQSTIFFDGGTSEVTGNTASVVIDGNTINNASIYSVYTVVSWNQVSDQEATINPLLYSTNNSLIYINTPNGYFGGGTGQFTKTDGTSNTIIEGYNPYTNGAAQTFQNVIGPGFSPADTGAINAAIVTLPSGPGSLYKGLTVSFVPTVTNTTTTPTLNLNNFGAKTITKFGTSALLAGDLTSTALAQVIYDGTGWELQNPQTLATGTGANTALSNLAAVAINTPLLHSTTGCASASIPCYSFVGHTSTGLNIFTNDVALLAPTGAQIRWVINGTAIGFLGASNMNFGTDNSFSIGTSSSRIANEFIGGTLSWTNGSGTADTQINRAAAGLFQFGTTTSNSNAGLKLSYLQSGGTKFTASGCSNSTTVGGATSGKFASGTTGSCTVVITMGDTDTATNGWSCAASDLTTPANLISQSASSTTTCTITGTTVSGDIINFHAIAF